MTTETTVDTPTEIPDLPVALIEQVLLCPHCRAVNQIYERDTGFRDHPLSLIDGHIFASLADHEWTHERFFCGACDGEVDLPSPVEDYS